MELNDGRFVGGSDGGGGGGCDDDGWCVGAKPSGLYYKRRAILPPGVLPIIVENSSAKMKPASGQRSNERNVFGMTMGK